MPDEWGNGKGKFHNSSILSVRPLITSLSNSKIKEAVKLREGKYRRRTGLCLIEGWREVGRAIQSGVEITDIFLEENGLDTIEAAGCFVDERLLQPVSRDVYTKIAFGERQDGVLAIAKQPELALPHFLSKIRYVDSPLFAVLENIEKPGNVGAVFRSADGASLDGVVLTQCLAASTPDCFAPSAIRNSMGTVFRVPRAHALSEEAIFCLRQRNISLAAARCAGTQDQAIPYTKYDFRKPTAIVLGNEAEGLSDIWRGDDVTAITIPMLGMGDSLNISVAAAVLFFEARRQRLA